jgi:hypothetical protein
MRIRTTKPEFWRSKDTARLSFPHRLLFIGLWNYCDDNGVGEDDEALIRADLFPRDDVQEASELVRGGLQELSRNGQILRYEDTGTGRKYLMVTGWHHQRIDKPSQCKKPFPNSEDCVLLDDSGSTPRPLPDDSRLYLGTKGSRDQGSGAGARPRATCQKHPDGTTTNCGPCGRARVQAEQWDLLQEQEQANHIAEAKAKRDACQLCDERGMREVANGVTRCDHPAVSA